MVSNRVVFAGETGDMSHSIDCYVPTGIEFGIPGWDALDPAHCSEA